MKIILTMAIALMTITGFSQTKWRTLTLRTTTAVSFEGELNLSSSMNIYYELNNNFAITNWTGTRYSFDNTGWFGSQTQLTKGIGTKHWKVGTGIAYRSNLGIGDGGLGFDGSNIFYTVSLSKRFYLP